MSSVPISNDPGAAGQRLESILSQATFGGLKAVLECLCADREARYAGILGADTYEQLVAKLGYKLILTRQIHVQDCYQRVGPEGGIRAVLPYYDIPTQSSLPTLVNFDMSLTTTPKAAAFFEALLGELKKRMSAKIQTTH